MALAQLSHCLLDGNPARLVVVDGGQGLGLIVLLVQKLFGDEGTENNVVGAAAPLPGLAADPSVALAAAVAEAALGAVA